MKKVLIIFGLVLAVILQSSLVPFLEIYGVVPNLVLVLALFVSIQEGFDNSWKQILLAGLLLDLFSRHLFGLLSVCLVLTVYIISLVNIKFFSVVRFWIISVSVAAGTFFYGVLLFLLIKLSHGSSVLNFKYLAIESLYNLAVLILLYLLYGAKKIFYKE